jgi:hypothetical protein
MMDGVRFHHFGLALQNDGFAITYFQAMGYEIPLTVYDPEQNVNLRLCTHPDQPAVEMVMPGQGDGPLTPLLKRYNELVYHICYEVSDPESWLSYMDIKGVDYAEVVPRKPAVLFGGRHVSFYRARGIGLIEVLWPE